MGSMAPRIHFPKKVRLLCILPSGGRDGCVYVYTGTHVYAGYRPFEAKCVVLETMNITPTTL